MNKKPPVVLEDFVRFARNSKTFALFDKFSLFFSHVRNISQKTFSERCSRMAETMNDTALSETQWVVLKKIDHGYPCILYRFAGFRTFHPLSLRCNETDATVKFSPSSPFVIRTQRFLVGWNTATVFRE